MGPGAHHRKHGVEHVIVELADTAVLLELLDGVGRRGDRAIRAHAARQRLGTDKAAGAHVDLRLQVDRKPLRNRLTDIDRLEVIISERAPVALRLHNVPLALTESAIALCDRTRLGKGAEHIARAVRPRASKLQTGRISGKECRACPCAILDERLVGLIR